jgi:hypothetical protein
MEQTPQWQLPFNVLEQKVLKIFSQPWLHFSFQNWHSKNHFSAKMVSIFFTSIFLPRPRPRPTPKFYFRFETKSATTTTSAMATDCFPS